MTVHGPPRVHNNVYDPVLMPQVSSRSGSTLGIWFMSWVRHAGKEKEGDVA